MGTITSINYYSSAWKVFDENTTRAEFDAIPADVIDAIKHVDDFEPYAYVLINGATIHVIDSFNGDVFNTLPLEEFKAETIKYAMED